MSIAFRLAGLAAALAFGAVVAAADPIITVVYDPGVAFTAADETQIQDAINFYTANIISTFNVTIAVGGIAGGGAQSSSFYDTANYSDYYSALVANSSGDATDTTAIASLGGPNGGNNPVTGSSQIAMTSTLAALLGVGSQVSQPFAGCGNLTASACIQVGLDVLNTGDFPPASLMGTFEHEFDEVLGTSSALPDGGGHTANGPQRRRSLSV